MKKIIWCLYIFTAIGYTQSLDGSEIQKIDSILENALKEYKIPGLAISIVSEGKLVWAKGYGYSDLENKTLTNKNTVFRSASIGKSITATAIMQLVERGKLDLDLPIQKYCPAFPKKQYTITTRHLLNHTSGIRHYGGMNHEQELYSKVQYKNITEPLNIFKNDSLLFKPGSKYLYSTYGYNVLGCIIEGITGMTYIDYLKENVFLPSNMLNTAIDNPTKIIYNRSEGYQLDNAGNILNAEFVNMSNKIPAGGFVTTVVDLANFVSNFYSDQLVSEATKESMISPKSLNDGSVLEYGFGWALFPNEKWYGQREAFHGGGTPGVSGIMYTLPDIKLGVVILMNMEGISDKVGLAANIAKELIK